ncbi:MAG: response regulator, partial [Betaproteobacteria bacterium]|nr:response regulator [Betaproteobacteria bacterium]
MNVASRGRVLIAEDEPPIVASLEFLLKNRRIDTRTAPDGKSALELAAEFRPHIVLLDVMLPKVSGFEVCRALRTKQPTRDLRVIFLTARG